MASTLGARLRRLREAKKLTLQQVADAVGCTKAYIWELEMKEGQRRGVITRFVAENTFEHQYLFAQIMGVRFERRPGLIPNN